MAILNLLLTALLSEATVLEHIKEAGFSEEVAPVMLCIARYESGFDPSVINTNRNGSKDYGLFQINDRWWKEKCDLDKLLDPAYNTKCAKIVYDIQGLEAWVAYKKNREVCNGQS